MAQKEEIIIKVKTDTKDAGKGLEKVKTGANDAGNAAKSAAGEFTVMGVSINGVKTAIGKLIPIAKGMFTTIKAGIASTGIGLLVIAIGSLVTYFTSTKRGAETLQVAFKGIGAAISVITDRISSIGEAITKVFKGDFKGAAEDAKKAVTGLGAEIVKETKSMMELTRTLQGVRDAERDFSKERAETNRVIAEARFLAEDENASYEDRLEALKKANDLEIATTEKAIAIQKEKLEAKQAEVDLGESLAEDFDELAALEVELINMQTQSVMKQKRLVTSVETLKTEMRAADKQRNAEELKEKQELAKAEEDIRKKTNTVLDEIAILKAETDQEKEILKLEQQYENKQAEIEQSVASQEEKDLLLQALEEQHLLQMNGINQKYIDKKNLASEAFSKAEEKRRLDELKKEEAVTKAKNQMAFDSLGTVQDVFGKESKAGKAAAIAQTTINTYQAASKALAQFGVPVGIPFAALAVAQGLKQVQAITSTPEPEFAKGGLVRGAGTGTSDSISAKLSKGETVINAKSTKMFKPLLSAINQAGGGVGFANGGTLDTSVGGNTIGAVKAFVVTDDITNSQNSLEEIRKKATI